MRLCPMLKYRAKLCKIIRTKPDFGKIYMKHLDSQLPSSSPQPLDFFETVFEAMPSAALLDKRGVILRTNRSWWDFGNENGLAGPLDSVGINYLGVCDASARLLAEGAAEASAGIRSVLNGATDEFSLEYPCHAPHEQRWFNLRVKALPTDFPARLLILHENVTPLKLAALQGEALERERREFLEGFLEGFGHDVRTPLTGLGTALSLLQKHVAPEGERFLDRMDSALNRLTRAFVSLMNAFELAHPYHQTVKREVGLRDLLERVYRQYQTTAEAFGHRFELDDSAPDIRLNIDEDLIIIALNHLLENAVNYTPRGGHIVLSAERVNNTEVEIAVQDNGGGISAADLPHIFEQFYRADKSRQAQSGNVGLGLPMVRQIASLHDGGVSVDTLRGAGSTFKIRLPIA